MKLISFIPQTASYMIYYPETFILDEFEDGIVSITSPETASNLTLSGYQVNQTVTEDVLVKLFDDMTEEYESRSELKFVDTTQDLFIEKFFYKNGINWIWWALAKENQIIMITINSENELCEEDYNLFRFMIDKLEICPSEYEEGFI